MISGMETALSRELQDLPALFRQLMIELPGDQIDEIVRQAKQEAMARAKTIIGNAITQAILERALVELGNRPAAAVGEEPGELPAATPVEAPADVPPEPHAEAPVEEPALSAAETRRADEQIREEIRRVREEISANEEQLAKITKSAPDEASALPDPAAEAEQAQNCDSPTGLGFYVYAIIGSDVGIPPGSGIDPEHPIDSVPYQGLRAVVSNVSLDEFSEEAFRNQEWLMAKVQAHESILDGISASLTVVPMRFCTIYSSEEHVREMLAEHHDDFASALARLDGKQEWGVKAYCAPGVLLGKVAQVSDAVKSLTAEVADKSDAASYFVRKKLDDTIQSERERITDEVAQESHNSLWMRSWEAVVNPLQDREVTGREDDMVLNGAYLISQECAEAFQAELDGLRQRYTEFGFTYELSGPWPPYNFASAVPREDPVDEPVSG